MVNGVEGKSRVNTNDVVEHFRDAVFESRPVEQKRAKDLRL